MTENQKAALEQIKRDLDGEDSCDLVVQVVTARRYLQRILEVLTWEDHPADDDYVGEDDYWKDKFNEGDSDGRG